MRSALVWVGGDGYRMERRIGGELKEPLTDLSVLDVGCGDSPHGDVNTDLFLEDAFKHRSNEINHDIRFKLNTKTISNFCLAEGSHLPFKDNAFDLVISSQVIEHVPKPALMAKEMVRISKDIVVIETVHRRGERLSAMAKQLELNKVHINKFDYTYFGALAKALSVNLIWNEALIKTPILVYNNYTFPIINYWVPFVIRIVFGKKTKDWGAYINHKTNKQSYLKSLGLDL